MEPKHQQWVFCKRAGTRFEHVFDFVQHAHGAPWEPRMRQVCMHQMFCVDGPFFIDHPASRNQVLDKALMTLLVLSEALRHSKHLLCSDSSQVPDGTEGKTQEEILTRI